MCKPDFGKSKHALVSPVLGAWCALFFYLLGEEGTFAGELESLTALRDDQSLFRWTFPISTFSSATAVRSLPLVIS